MFIDEIEKTVVPLAISAANTISFEVLNLAPGEHSIEVLKGVDIDTSFTITGFDIDENSLVTKPDWKVGDYVTATVYPDGNSNTKLDANSLSALVVNPTEFNIRQYKGKSAKKLILTGGTARSNGYITGVVSKNNKDYITSGKVDNMLDATDSDGLS